MNEDEKKFGNQSDVARKLGISRQAVAKLIKNRKRTGFPIAELDGSFNLETVANWYVNEFQPRSGPKAGIRAES